MSEQHKGFPLMKNPPQSKERRELKEKWGAQRRSGQITMAAETTDSRRKIRKQEEIKAWRREDHTFSN